MSQCIHGRPLYDHCSDCTPFPPECDEPKQADAIHLITTTEASRRIIEKDREIARLRARLSRAEEVIRAADHEMEQALQMAGAGFCLAGENMEGLRRAIRSAASWLNEQSTTTRTDP